MTSKHFENFFRVLPKFKYCTNRVIVVVKNSKEVYFKLKNFSSELCDQNNQDIKNRRNSEKTGLDRKVLLDI